MAAAAFSLEGKTCNRDAIGARVEIKVPGPKKHIASLVGLEPIGNPQQMHFGLRVTGRKWIDTVSFNPDPKIPNVVIRIHRDDLWQKQLGKAMDVFQADTSPGW